MSKMRRLVKRALSASWTMLEGRAARSYVAGSELDDAVNVCRRFATEGVASTVCRWNASDEAPADIARSYVAAVRAARRESLDCHVSIKAPALGLSGALVQQIVEEGNDAGIGIHFDAQRWEFAESMLALIAAMSRLSGRIGCTLPGRWRRSLEDARLANQLGLRTRVVKGQNADPREPARDPHRGFLDVIEQLAGSAKLVAVATHDAALARQAVQRLVSANTPCELELLYGLPMRAPLRVAAELRVPVRIYVPYGAASVPYHYTDCFRDPRVMSWLVQDLAGTKSSKPNGRTIAHPTSHAQGG